MPLTANASRLPMKESCAISEIGGGYFVALYMAHDDMTVLFITGFGGKYVMDGYKNVGHTGGMSHMFCWEKRIS